MRRALAIGLLVAGCGSDLEVTGDGFPIGVDLSGGPVIAQYREGDGSTQTAVIDLLAPMTVLDAPDEDLPSRRYLDLTLLGLRGADPPVPRAHLSLTVTRMHACPAGAPCQIGAEGAMIEIDAVIGADALDSGAVRFDFLRSELALFPDIAGEDRARGRLCEAVLSRPFRGGGTLFLGGTELAFPARRIAVSACLSFDPEVDPDLVTDRGADVLLVVSTGIGPTILSRTAYQRWRQAFGPTAPELDSLPAGRVYLPSGPIDGKAGTVDRMALVGGDNEVRGACRQTYAHHLLSERECASGDDCPCDEGTTCRIPAIVELTPVTPIEVLVIDDDHPVLQALRAELRPDTAEVDGLLGTAALAPTSIDVDFLKDRVLVRCEAEGCAIRPELITDALAGLVRECLAR